MNIQAPTHPGRQEQGLGAPQQAKSSGMEFHKRNGSLAAREAKMSGEQAAREQSIAQKASQAGLQQGQIEATNAMTNKLMRERAILEQANARFSQPTTREGLMPPAEEYMVPPEQVEVQQITDLLKQGATPEQLVQSGRHPEFVNAAMGAFQAEEAATINQYNQAQGL